MKMRDLVAKTGVNREAIRFYIREGLLPEPERPRRNVASYSEAHVRGIEMIRSLQRDPDLTLGMIKRIVQGEPVTVSTLGGYAHKFSAILAHRLQLPSDPALVPIKQLIERQPLAERYIEAFAKSGVIDKVNVAGEEYLDFIDAQILMIWVASRAQGFEEALGFGPQGILPFAQAMESLAKTVMQFFITQVWNQLDEAEAAHLAQTGIGVANAILPLLFTRSMLREAIKQSDTAEQPDSSAP